jgi:hypothetical protein
MLMRYRLYFRAGFKRLVIFAITALCISFAPSAKAQTTTWKIQLDVINPVPKPGSPSTPVYKLLPPTPKPAKERCAFTDPNVISAADNLQVCPGDTIDWVVRTNSPDIEVFLYYQDAVLLDDDGDPNHGFHASNQDPVEGIVTDDATSDKYYKYYVVVLDKDKSVTYYDDPKIMIGTGNQQVALANAIAKQAKQLELKVEKLKKLIDSQRIQKR